jgi:hypothetical protein
MREESQDHPESDKLSDEEMRLLSALPRTLEPRWGSDDRLIARLRERGVVDAGTDRWRRLLTLSAAAVLLFVAGAGTGYVVARSRSNATEARLAATSLPSPPIPAGTRRTIWF